MERSVKAWSAFWPRTIAVFFLALVLHGCGQTGPAPEKRPNIILILADDLGYSDLGFFGSEIMTPNLDRLAEEGLILTQFYTAARCCPSRASLLTGLNPHQAGVGYMTKDMKIPGYRGFLNEGCATIAELLQESGYTTLMSGKWHVGKRPEHWPRKRGFDRFFGFPEGGGVYFAPFHRNRLVVLDDDPIEVDEETFYSTDAITKHAIQFLEESRDEGPFFLFLSHVAPHFPLQAHEEDIARYRGRYREGFPSIRKKRFDRLRELGFVEESWRLSAADGARTPWAEMSDATRDQFDLRMSVYAAQITCMDRGIGAIFEKLTELSELENTVIFFLSDNGASNEALGEKEVRDGPIGTRDSFTTYRTPWANVSNTPFRSYKRWVHEGGLAAPLLVHNAGLIPESRSDSRMAHVMDLLPTCLDLASAPYPARFQGRSLLPLSGKSLVPLIRGEPGEVHEQLCWEHEGNRAIRKGRWKLVSAYPSLDWELYDMERDRTETEDLAAQNPKIVKELSRCYDLWASRCGVLPWRDLIRRQ